MKLRSNKSKLLFGAIGALTMGLSSLGAAAAEYYCSCDTGTTPARISTEKRNAQVLILVSGETYCEWRNVKRCDELEGTKAILPTWVNGTFTDCTQTVDESYPYSAPNVYVDDMAGETSPCSAP